MKVIHIFLTLVYVILLILALIELTLDNICDDQNCRVFTRSNEIKYKNRVIYILDKLCEESVWPIAYIAASILSTILFIVLPIQYTIMAFATTFLIVFITFYSISSFMIYHYIIPIKKYIIEKIKNHKNRL